MCWAAAAACGGGPATPASSLSPLDLTVSSLVTQSLPAPSAKTATLSALATPARQPAASTPVPGTSAPANPPAATPVPPPAAEVSPAPTACDNDARFIRDASIPDGMQLLPGQLIVKKWSVKNTGTCDWGPDYRLALINGDALGAPSAVALYPARAGASANWEVPMVAPQSPGEYVGKWQARDPAGNLFGAVVFIKIEVIPLPTVGSP